MLPPMSISLGARLPAMRREPASTYNSGDLIGVCNRFDWIDEVPAAAESSPEYLESINNKRPELALVLLTAVLVTVSQNLMAYNL
jgi:hypothetical protein